MTNSERENPTNESTPSVYEILSWAMMDVYEKYGIKWDTYSAVWVLLVVIAGTVRRPA